MSSPSVKGAELGLGDMQGAVVVEDSEVVVEGVFDAKAVVVGEGEDVAEGPSDAKASVAAGDEESGNLEIFVPFF